MSTKNKYPNHPEELESVATRMCSDPYFARDGECLRGYSGPHAITIRLPDGWPEWLREPKTEVVDPSGDRWVWWGVTPDGRAIFHDADDPKVWGYRDVSVFSPTPTIERVVIETTDRDELLRRIGEVGEVVDDEIS